MEHRRTIQVEWGHCDPLGIVFYPHYFVWFDECTQGLLRQAGLDQHSLPERFPGAATPLVDVGASFRAPVTHGDVLEATSRISRWGRRSFTVSHRLACGGETAVEGHEVRTWAVRDRDAPRGLRAEPVPEAFRRLFGEAGRDDLETT